MTDHLPPYGAPGFWQSSGFLLAVAMLTTIPLLLPDTPPLVDLPGHLGRYRIQLDLGSSPPLQRFFGFEWQLIGNLGVDLLMIPMARLFGLELAAKLIVLAIPVLTAAGVLWMAHEVHGRVPPTALVAVPFAYNFAFNWGFINFALSIAFAFLAFAWWLRLGRKGHYRLRAALFVGASSLVWLCHAFGWGVLGVLLFGGEFARARQEGRSAVKSVVTAMVRGVPAAAPILLMVLWRTAGAEGLSSGFFQFDLKLFAVAAALRDRWLVWDALGVAIALVLLAAPAFDRRLGYAATLAVPALLLALIFVLMPAKLFGSAYADARLAPVAMMVALAALHFRSPVTRVTAVKLAVLACLFLAARLGGNFANFAQADREARQQLVLLDAVPAGSRVLFLTEQDCELAWPLPRTSHLGSFTIVRRSGFSNDQWDLPGSQLVRITYDAAGEYRSDPSQFYAPERCSAGGQSASIRYAGAGSARIPSLDAALARLPREAFDYAWVIGDPAATATLDPRLRLVRRTPRAALFAMSGRGDRSR